MKRLLLFMILGGLVTVVPDALQGDRARVEQDGKRYEIRRDVLNPNELRVYDSKGQAGTVKRDVLRPDRWRYEERR